MKKISLILILVCGVVLIAVRVHSVDSAQADEIVSLERTALDQWGRGNPNGFLDIYGSEVTYFDPGTEHRIDGRAAMADYYLPFTGKIKVVRYEMIGPKVQRQGEVAVLTYNLRSETIQPDNKEVTVRWNSTSVYARIGGKWKVIHSHWSLTALPCARGIN